jgi:hypothetical protein
MRTLRLREAGVIDDELALLHSPIGLDLGSRIPQETAIAVFAEIVPNRHGGSSRPLSLTSGASTAERFAETEVTREYTRHRSVVGDEYGEGRVWSDVGHRLVRTYTLAHEWSLAQRPPLRKLCQRTRSAVVRDVAPCAT